MHSRTTNKKRRERDSGLNSLLSLILRRALPVWDRFHEAVPPNVLKRLDKEGDWPHGVAAAAIERLSSDEQLREGLREP
jgi:hypothetical protein